MNAQAPRKSLLPVRQHERILVEPGAGQFAHEAWFSVTLAVISVVHAIVLVILLWHDATRPPPSARAEETPVEVVIQAPVPQPVIQPPAPPPPEMPATSAPRAHNEETLERDATAAESHAPKAAAQPQQSAPSLQQASRPDDAKPDEAKPDHAEEDSSAAKPSDAPKDAEALDQAPPEPPRRPAKLAKTVKPTPLKSPPKVPRTALQQLAGASELPDYAFAKPMRKRAKVTGGTEDDRYLAVVYALVTRNQAAIPLPDGIWTVAGSFQVDGSGNLIDIGLAQSSGYRQVDAAALEAVERAAPFPPPPSGGVTGLISRLRSAESQAALTRGR